MATQNRKHYEVDPQDYAGLPAFRDLVRSGFQQADYSDFTIHCGEKGFKVHKFVLQSIKYFRNIFKGGFKESATNQINLQEDNADIVELLLAVVYGAHYGKWVASRCGRATEASKLVEPLETSLSVDGAARSFTASSEDLCTPTQECLDLKRLAKGPAPALAIYRERNAFDATLAEYFCVELKMHLDACTIADKYGVAELKRVAEASFADLLGDCWLSPKVLEVIKQLMSGPLGLESSLADVTISGLAARLSMFTPTEKLVDSLSASHPDFARLVLKQVILGSHAYETDVSTLRYCSWHMCRRNVKAKFVQGGRYVGNKYECTLCGNNLFVQSEAWKVNI